MDDLEKVLFLINAAMSGAALITGPLAAKFLMKSLRKTHLNLRILIKVLGVTFCLLPVSNLASTLIILCAGSVPAASSLTVYFIFKNLLSVTSHMTRLTCVCICVERILATVYSRTYEKSTHFTVIVPFLVSILLFLAIVNGLFYNLGMYPVWVNYVFLISQNAFNVIVSFVIGFYSITAVENLRVLKLLRPQILIEVISGILGTALPAVVKQYSFTLIFPVYFLICNCYIITVALYWGSRKEKIRPVFHYMEFPTKHNFPSSETDPVIVMTLGKVTKGTQTAEEHFSFLKLMWSK